MAAGLRTLVIGHDHVAGLGHFGRALEALGFDLHPVTVVPESRFTSPDVSYTYPAHADWDAIIRTGAPWPRSQTQSWWPREVEFLRTSHELVLQPRPSPRRPAVDVSLPTAWPTARGRRPVRRRP